MAQQGNWGQTGYQRPEYGQPYPSRPYDPVAHRRRLETALSQQVAAWNQAGYGPQPPYPSPSPSWPQPQAQPGAQSGPQPGSPSGPQSAPQNAPSPERKRHTTRNTSIAAATALAAVIATSVAVAVAATGTHTVKTTAKSDKQAQIGDSITLAGTATGEQMAVTVTKVIARARPADHFDTAQAGDRLYAVQFRLGDTGSAAYADAPANGAAVVDSKGQSYDSSLDDAAGCVSFPGTENIAPGSTGLGCVVFEVPKHAKIVRVQFTLDSGFGPQTGQWKVG